MEATAPPSGMVLEELKTAYQRVRAAPSALRLWERVLSQEDRVRLGGDFAGAYAVHGTVGMWMRLRGVSFQRALVDVAGKIGFITAETQEYLLRGMGDLEDDPKKAIAQAVSDGALVLVERPQAAYWNGEEIAVQWHANPKLWKYVFELGREVKAGRPLKPSIFGENADVYYLTKVKSRLGKLAGFPPSLGDLIVPAGQGTQRLSIPPQQIRIFSLATSTVLREQTG